LPFQTETSLCLKKKNSGQHKSTLLGIGKNISTTNEQLKGNNMKIQQILDNIDMGAIALLEF